MPYEYGSEQIQIRNPFRFEGAAYVIRSVIFLGLGLYLLLQVKDLVASGERDLGIGELAGGIVLLVLGVIALSRGLFKIFRFYVGRGQPADLVVDASSEGSIMPGASTGGTTHFEGVYYVQMLSDMLLNRKNVTFSEPVGWLSRLLHSLHRKLIFLPPGPRNDAQSRFAAAAYTLAILVLFALTWFAGVSGVVPMSGTPIMAWLTLTVAGLLLLVWLRESQRLWHAQVGRLLPFGPGGLVAWSIIAVLAPVALFALHSNGLLPAPPLSPTPWLIGILLAGAFSFGFSMLLALRRCPEVPPHTEVSEAREHWQESVHPMDIFRAVEMTLAKHRYKEIANRIYENDTPELRAQGANNQGDFEGRSVQEIQPQPMADRGTDPVIKAGIAMGQLLYLGAGLCLFLALLGLTDLDPLELTRYGLAAVILWFVGRLIAQTAHLYASEIEFDSDLISLSLKGTFSESRVATGMGIYDSTRSENLVVRSSLTPWLLVSRLRTSIFATSGSRNLEGHRFILNMETNKPLSDELVTDLLAFLHDRQIMASVTSENDLQAAANIYRMNEETRKDFKDRGTPLISQETRDDKPAGTGLLSGGPDGQ